MDFYIDDCGAKQYMGGNELPGWIKDEHIFPPFSSCYTELKQLLLPQEFDLFLLVTYKDIFSSVFLTQFSSTS